MDSHEERVFLQIKEAQEKAAKAAMAEKAKEFKRMQKEALSRGLKPGAGSSFSSANAISSQSTPLTAVSDLPASKPAAASASRPSGGGKALKLGAKTKDEDAFLNQLRQQGQAIAPVEKTSNVDRSSAAPLIPSAAAVKREAVHVRTEEKITASVSRDGGLQNAEVFGTVTLCVASPEFNTVAMKMNNARAQSGAQLQVHPNLDKKEWQATGLLKLKSANKPFPASSDVGVLKWRLILQAEDELPLTLNVWPEESADGCQVNIEYTLQDKSFSLENVQIHIPLPPATAPVVSECEGSYEYLKPRNQLLWTLPSIDSSNDSGTLEFSVPNGHKDHFFPVNVTFYSEKLMVPITVEHIETMDGSSTDVVHSTETRLVTDKYEIV
ncbi:hypothetical protein WR25_07846 [Diploscapter pachys]|uniref:Coatomer subunit delta n=1 Tax=Diploscapter pachys TaxID=2018661 RepID=A0A2A2JF79_9BILA|nr:hypothetical protein WR25_07846 [Diploscapter pachys]